MALTPEQEALMAAARPPPMNDLDAPPAQPAPSMGALPQAPYLKRPYDALDRIASRAVDRVAPSVAPTLITGGDFMASVEPSRPFDLMAAMRAGWRTTLPSLFTEGERLKNQIRTTWGALDADPTYDVFADPSIKDAGLEARMDLFASSRSANETRYIIGRVRQADRDAADLAGMAGPAQAVSMAAGMALDPTSYLPLGGFGGSLILHTAQRGAWGYLSAGAKSALFATMIQAGTIMARREVDPSYFEDSVTLPLAFAAGIGTAAGFMRQAQLRRLARLGQPADGLPGHFSVGPDEWGPPAGLPGEGPPGPPGSPGQGPLAASRAVSPTGELVPVYHGTAAIYRDMGLPGQERFWFAADPALASAYAGDWVGANIHPAYLDLRNPLIVDAGGKTIQEVGTFGLQQRLVAGGHDGIILRNVIDSPIPTTASRPTDVYVATRPDQIIPKVEHDARMAIARGPKFQPLEATAPAWGDLPGAAKDLSAAAVRPGASPSAYAGLLDRESLAETGIGLEKFRWTPVMRLKASASLYARQMVEQLADMSGLLSKKNQVGAYTGSAPQATTIAVENRMAQNFTPKLISALQGIEEQWLLGRGKAARPAGSGEINNALQSLKLWGTDKLGVTAGIAQAEFDVRVGQALRRLDKDPVQDIYTPYVEAAARHARQLFNDVKEQASLVGLFEKAYTEKLAQAERLVERLKKTPRSPEELAAAEAQAEKARQMLDKLYTDGPSTNTAPSYLPRYWLVDELRSRADEFLQITQAWLTNTKKMDPDEAAKVARQIHDRLARITARPDLSEIASLFEEALNPMSAMARSFEIPDQLVESFLESNASIILRHHVRTMAPDIELMRAFDETNLEGAMERVRAEYKQVLDRTANPQQRFELNRQRESDIEDIKALRDKLRGTYGAEKDPHNWSSRTIRVLKNYAVWTTMGLSAFSQMGDLFRPAIVEGMDAVNRHGFGALVDDSRKLIWQMAHQERLQAGDTLELVTAARALSASDVGDIFMSRSKLERQANQMTGLFYMLNGMNMATDFTKDWASLIIQGRMNEAIGRWMKALDGSGEALQPWEIERFASLGIDEAWARRIGHELQANAATFKSTSIANTAAWEDTYAAERYRTALLRSLQRNVVTPTVGDKANWMSTELGSLVMMFRSFGASSAIRTLYAGLQEKGYNFWTGAAVLIGGAAVLNEIRKQVFYDKSSLSQPYLGVLADAVDRSGILGIFFDSNNALEVVSNGELGVRPFLGAGQRYNPMSRVANSLGGPVAGQAAKGVEVLGDIMSGNASARTWRQMRSFVPGQNLPYADPVFDAMFPSGSGKVGRLSGTTVE